MYKKRNMSNTCNLHHYYSISVCGQSYFNHIFQKIHSVGVGEETHK